MPIIEIKGDALNERGLELLREEGREFVRQYKEKSELSKFLSKGVPTMAGTTTSDEAAADTHE